jgi:hypothetical protein
MPSREGGPWNVKSFCQASDAIRQYIRSQAADLRAGKAKVPMGEAHGG